MNVPQNLLQLAWGAATSKLEDKEDYPLFLRVHPTQSRVTDDMVQVLKKLKSQGKVDTESVVLMSTSSNYGKTGKEVKAPILHLSFYLWFCL